MSKKKAAPKAPVTLADIIIRLRPQQSPAAMWANFRGLFSLPSPHCATISPEDTTHADKYCYFSWPIKTSRPIPRRPLALAQTPEIPVAGANSWIRGGRPSCPAP